MPELQQANEVGQLLDDSKIPLILYLIFVRFC